MPRDNPNIDNPPTDIPNENIEVADILDRVADLLEAQRADHFRVRAYRNGAQACRDEIRSLALIVEDEGLKGLERLPHIGKSLAASIAEYVHTGHLHQLDRLEGEVSPQRLFATLPGIGEELAHRIHKTLGVETLEDLEVAAHDGRLGSVPGIGERRTHAIRDSVAAALGLSARGRGRRMRGRELDDPADRPSVSAILEVDAEYRERAERGGLRRIAPRRFNPKREAWLPILHTTREGWFFTALFSNTERAHRLGATRDWVVIFHDRDGRQGRCTVVTEHTGALRGMRVVRGRETEVAVVEPAPP